MSAVLAGVLISLGILLCGALVAAGGALWRLGTKVGTFEAAVTTANNAAVAAKQASVDAQAAAQRAAADAVAAARLLYDEMQKAVGEFQRELVAVKQELAKTEGRWREAHELARKINDHEKRLYAIERDHERNHGPLPIPPQQSERHYIALGDASRADDLSSEDDAPPLEDSSDADERGGQ